jgi:hypothetical protein
MPAVAGFVLFVNLLMKELAWAVLRWLFSELDTCPIAKPLALLRSAFLEIFQLRYNAGQSLGIRRHLIAFTSSAVLLPSMPTLA